MNAPRLFTRRGFSICLSCRRNFMRHFSSTPAPFASFQSYPLNPRPQTLPRNASIPDSSIAHPVQSPSPRVHETRPPKEAPKEASTISPMPQTSVREQEAQTSKREFAAGPPTTASSSSSSSPPPSPPPSSASTSAPAKEAAAAAAAPAPSPAPAAKPRSKLRAPRKAAIKLTPAAVSQLRAMLDQPDPKLIKVGVRNRGCSGLSYNLEYVDRAGAFDEAVEQDGVKVLIDSKALFSIIGTEMDWVEDKLSQRFVFRNPNIKEQCGCGESFMV